MGRGSAPQGGAGNYGGSKSAKPRKPRNVTNSFKVKSAATEQPEEEESTPAFTVTRPSRERRANLLRAHRKDEAAAAQLAARAAAIARRPVNGTSPGGEVLGGDTVPDLAPSVESLREARLQHLAKQQGENHPGQASSQIIGSASASSSSAIVCESSPVLLSEDDRLRALEALLRQPNVHSWQQRRAVTNGVEDESDADIRDDELHVLVVFLLDTLSDRVGPVDAMNGVRLLQTVLGNVTKGDPKYRRLKASNNKLWAGLLQHPELCMVLEAGGFGKGTEEEYRHMELGHLESRIQELLESRETIDEAQIEVLLHRMEELKKTPISSDPSGDTGNECDTLVGRTATLLHPAIELLLGDLAIVLEAVADWTPLSIEEVCQGVHDSPFNEAAEAKADSHPSTQIDTQARPQQ
mmetsp:Transcript_135177/g.233614  ORF Transcript_135177/g.233614 Transcript_135177/m.233614 type:complete len:410 (+) Transcript_135177:89-1318(+)